jgi:hypothetical protein
MTDDEKEKLIKKWEPLLTVEISLDATALLIEPMEATYEELECNETEDEV